MTAVLYRVRSLLRARWKAALAIAAVVAISFGLTLTLAAGATRTLSAPGRYVDSSALSVDAGIEQFEGSPRTAEIRELPAVRAAESATFVFGGLAPTGSIAPGEPVDMLALLDGLVFAGSPDALGLRLVAGRAADPARPTEFVASPSFTHAAGARLGDTFTLVTLTPTQAAAAGFDVAMPEGPMVEVTLVGIAEGSSTLQDDYPVVMFAPVLLDGGDIGISATQMTVHLAPGSTLDDLRTQLDGLPNGDQFGIERLDIVPDAVRRAVRTQGIGLVVLAVIVAAATIVVAGQLLAREVQLPDAPRSALRTLGMTDEQLRGESLIRAALPVAVGVLCAVVIAVATSGVFPSGFARDVEPQPGVRFDPLVHLIGPLCGVAALLTWVRFDLTRRAQRTPRPTSGASDRIASWFGSPKVATAIRFAFTDDQRQTGSPRTQTTGLCLVLVLAVGALTFGVNVGRLVDDPVRHGSAELGVGSGGGEIPAEVRDRLAADDDVAAFTLFARTVVSAGSFAFDVAGALPVKGDMKPVVLEGRLPTAGDEIALGKVEAARLGVGVDDEIDVAGSAGEFTWHVTGLVVTPGVEGGEGMGEGGFMTLEGVRIVDPSAPVSAGFLRLRADAPTGTPARLSTLAGMSIGRPDQPPQIVNLARVRSLPFLLVGVLGLLAMLNLGHQLIQSVRQRRRDVAILRALGAGRNWVSSVVHWQATMLAILVAAVAVPGGYVVGRAVYLQVAGRIGAGPDVLFPVSWLLVGLTCLLVLANVAAAVPSRRAGGLPPAEHLNRE